MAFDRFNRNRRRTGPTRLRSKLEEAVDYELDQLGVEHSYESESVKYVVHHTYTPDFTVPGPHPFHIEVKGWLSVEDRSKLLNVVMANPTLPLLVVFQNPEQKIRKGSKRTVAEWATKYGIPWAPIPIPKEILMSWRDGKRCTSHVRSAIQATGQASTQMDGLRASAVATGKAPTSRNT